jgi:hypothetical protein
MITVVLENGASLKKNVCVHFNAFISIFLCSTIVQFAMGLFYMKFTVFECRLNIALSYCLSVGYVGVAIPETEAQHGINCSLGH